MKNNTSNQLVEQSKPISKARAAKEAPKFRELAAQQRKRAQDCLDRVDKTNMINYIDQINKLVADEKASADRYLLSAARYDNLADVLVAHAQSDS